MKTQRATRFLAAVLALMMLISLLPLSALQASAEGIVYVLDPAEFPVIFKGSKADGDTLKGGTDGYFTVFLSATAQVQGNGKDFDDGFTAQKRFHYSAPSAFEGTVINAVRIKTSGPATVKVWWGCGDVGRQVAVFDENGNVVTQTNEALAKNDLCISELAITEAGTYYIGNVVGNNYHYKIEVTEVNAAAVVQRTAWADVSAPVISEAEDNGEGEITVTVDAVVGEAGGDELVVTMLDSNGQQLTQRSSVLEQDSHTLAFAPEASGKYTFQAVLKREGEAEKPAAASKDADFVFPLANPILASAYSAGEGKISLIWNPVKEAVSYDVYCDGTLSGNTTSTEYTVEGLTVGQKYAFTVKAVRGDDSAESNSLSATATQEARRPWGFTYYGPSIREGDNGYTGDLNEDGKVTVYSENGRGKIVPASVDGVAFYYTAVPTAYNFTMRAKVTVDSWTYSNGQEGFGLMVADRLGTAGSSANFWNNQFMALATKIEYRYDGGTINDVDGTGTKYSMKLGLGAIAKTGVTPDNLALLEANDTNAVNNQFKSEMISLEGAAGEWEKDAGTYNIIGNYTGEVTGSIETALLTEFILEIQKNNTGYFITYYDNDGNILAQKKYYGADLLNQLDSDYVYAGFFAARNARATFSDVEFTTILATEDAPAEEKPVTKIEPTVIITSPTVTTNTSYPLTVDTNVSGTLKIIADNLTIGEELKITGGVRFTKQLSLNYGDNRIQVQFSPDPAQDLGPDTQLASTAMVSADTVVTCNKGFYHRKTVYVSPEGLPNGNGSKEYPLDIYTAVNNANAGQTIVLMEGTYKLNATVRIQRGMDGTAEQPIRMMADPAAASRPVLDFQGLSSGIVHGGSYWYFFGFDVTNSQDGQKGFQVSGHYNTLDQINAYYNGNTGIQISRYSGFDQVSDWPSHNLILNCTSYGNADPGYEDADGFAAKLTCGEGNVFDGCVAYNNADDGWDLYAKVETGSIGAVTIRNCVAYQNGYVMENGTLVEAGNGNGFKMGGESLSGKHILENSYAFFNKSKGIDSNSCPDIIVKDCVSYNNGTYNVALYTNNSANTNFSATGVISFKDSTVAVDGSLTQGENLKPKGTQDTAKYQGESNYYWSGSACVNASGKQVTADMFVSLSFQGVARKADGTIDMQGFLEKAASAPADAGVKAGGTASPAQSELPKDLEHTFSNTWFNEDAMYHWHECECGDKADIAEHTFKWVVDKEATETATGLKHEECSVCGYKKPAITTYYGDEIGGGQNGMHPGAIVAIVAAVIAAAGAVAVALKRKKSAK